MFYRKVGTQECRLLAQIIRSFMYRRRHGNLPDNLKELFALLNVTCPVLRLHGFGFFPA
jgi:hypothetical protein